LVACEAIKTEGKTQMKKAKNRELVVAAAIAGIILSGCGTITNAHVRHMNNQQLALRHYQLARKNTGRFAWGNAYSEMQDDQREQETIEREMMKRRLLNPLTSPQTIQRTPQIVYGNPTPNIQ
jgi:hypothetical protein